MQPGTMLWQPKDHHASLGTDPVLATPTLHCVIENMSNDGFKPTALRKAKIVYNFGLSECNRANYFW